MEIDSDPINQIQQIDQTLLKTIIQKRSVKELLSIPYISNQIKIINVINRYSIFDLVLKQYCCNYFPQQYQEYEQFEQLLAFTMHKNNSINIHQQDFKKIKNAQNYSLRKILQHKQSRYSFISSSLLNFYVVKYIIRHILQFQCIFRSQQIIKSQEVCQFIKDCFECNPKLYDKLMYIVLKSKTNKQIQMNSAGAITLLNLHEPNFSGIDFSKISIPHAQLAGAFFENTNFEDCNLQNVNFQRCFLLNTKFNRANVKGINFGYTNIKFNQRVRCMDINYNRNHIIVGGTQGKVQIFDLKQQIKIKQWTVQKKIYSIKYSYDGNIVATGLNDTIIQIFDTETGNLIKKLEGHTQNIQALTFSYDGIKIASISYDRTIRIWNIQSTQNINTIECNKYCFSINYSPDDKYLVTGTSKTIKIWNSQNGQFITQYQRHHSFHSINYAVYSPSGNKIASCGSDNKIIIYDSQKNQIIKILQKNRYTKSVIFTFDQKYIISAGQDQCIQIWDLQTGKNIKTLRGHTDTIQSIHLYRNKLISGSRDGTIKIWNYQLRKNNQIQSYNQKIQMMCLSPDQKQISILCDNKILIFDLQTRKRLKCVENVEFYRICYSPNCKHIASTNIRRQIEIWDSGTGGLIKRFQHKTESFSICYTNNDNGQRLVTGNLDNMIYIIDSETGSILKSILAHQYSVDFICCAPNKKFLASTSMDRKIKFWDLKTFDLLFSLEVHDFPVCFLNFSPSSDKLVASGYNTTIKIWDLQLKHQIKVIQSQNQYTKFCNDGSTLINYGLSNKIMIYDLESEDNIKSLYGHHKNIVSIHFSKDNKKIISGSNDSTIKIWNNPCFNQQIKYSYSLIQLVVQLIQQFQNHSVIILNLIVYYQIYKNLMHIYLYKEYNMNKQQLNLKIQIILLQPLKNQRSRPWNNEVNNDKIGIIITNNYYLQQFSYFYLYYLQLLDQ